MANQFHAIVVLGCGIHKNGELTDDARSSVEIAANLYRQQVAPLLIFSGGYSYKVDIVPAVCEAQAMKDYVVSLGVPSEKTLIEIDSRDTLGNVYFTKTKILRPLHLTNLGILGSPTHSKERLHYILDKILGNKYFYELVGRKYNGLNEHEEESLAITKSWLDNIENGDEEAVFKVMRELHPGYSLDSKNK